KLSRIATDQFEYRRDLIDRELDPLLGDYKIVGTVGRGGVLKPLKGGTYIVNRTMLDYLISDEVANHASNLGAGLADHYARRFGVDAYIVDPVTVDEFPDVARISGVPWILRKSRAHALNIKAVVRRASADIGIEADQSRYVVAHLGGGISIAAVVGGRIIDVNDALIGMGPYSPERAGALPIGPLIDRCFSGNVTKEELLHELSRNSGLKAYCGTSDVREILERIANGDQQADSALKGMIYQNVKEIGAMAAVLEGRLDAVLLTGGLAHSTEIVEMLTTPLFYLGKILVYPGEGELRALAQGAFRVIDGVEETREYL
ncbi:MAG: butyrate kinase, partial [Candidatus Electryoneaceae bacterium]|nr:butyrate kinase [Candidatus Electryoneaceae bacterium]